MTINSNTAKTLQLATLLVALLAIVVSASCTGSKKSGKGDDCEGGSCSGSGSVPPDGDDNDENPDGGSTNPNAIEAVWSFGNGNAFIFDPTSVDFDGDSVKLKLATSDINGESFASGTNNGVGWDGGSDKLTLADPTFNNFAFPEPLTSNHWFDMTDSIAVFHFDEGTFDNNSPVANAQTTSPIAGIVVDGPESANSVAGKLGQAIQLVDTDNNSVALGTDLDTLKAVSQASVTAWVKMDNINASDKDIVVFSTDNPSTTEERIRLTVLADETVQCSARAANEAAQAAISTSTLAINRWYQLGCVYDFASDNIKLFVNGIEETSQAVSFASTSTENTNVQAASIGAAANGASNTFPGMIDEVGIFARALTDADMRLIFQKQAPGIYGNSVELPNEGDPHGWFDMTGNVLLFHLNRTDFINGDAVVDYSGNNYHGEIEDVDASMTASQGKLGIAPTYTLPDLIWTHKLGNSRPILNNATAASAMAWVKLTGTSAAEKRVLAIADDQGYWASRLEMSVQGNEVLRCIGKTNRTAGGTPTSSTADIIHEDVWTHVACVYDYTNDTIRGYINGRKVIDVVESFEHAAVVNADSTSGAIGAEDDNSQVKRWPGEIDEVALWARELSDTEIAKVYNAQKMFYGGLYTSRVMDTGAANNWESITWNPERPYGHKLVGTGSESGYSAGADANVDMSAAILVLNMDEAPGCATLTDSSSVGRTVSTSTARCGYAGQVDSGTWFDGNNDQFNTVDANDLDLTATDFTMMAWIRPQTWGGTSRGTILDHSGYVGGAGWAFILDDASITEGLSYYVNNARYSSNNSVITLDKWQHVAVTYTGGNIAFYVDGVAQGGSAAVPAPLDSGNAVYVGLDTNTSARDFAGWMDEVAILTRAMTPTQIAEVYRRGATELQMAFRSCSASPCTSPFMGSDGTSETVYSEALTGVNSPWDTQLLDPSTYNHIPNNRYFQYFLVMGTDDNSTLPRLDSIEFFDQAYSQSAPSLQLAEAIDFSELYGFSYTLKSGSSGLVNFQVSPNNGTTWYWYDGEWKATTQDAAESSGVADIDAHIGTLTPGAGQFLFKAFLVSSGSEEVAIDSVTLNYLP